LLTWWPTAKRSRLTITNVNGIIAERLIRSFPNVIEIGARPFQQSVLGHGVRIIRMQAEPPEMGSYQ
jgi:hypothetical protein